MNLDIRGFGSNTFRREDIKRGFEPDACFYIQSVDRIKGVTKLDLATHPPPDLVVEIDITHPSLDKFPIYAQVGVPEVWRYDGQKLTILLLLGERYVEADGSSSLRRVTGTSFPAFLKKDNLERFRSGRTYCVSGHALPENVVVFENVSALEPLWTLLRPGQKAIRRFARPRAITVDQSVTSKVIVRELRLALAFF